ncbi:MULTISPECIES: hypothetical protein [Microbacterium]|uniref:hypothetical protein n=1 Tax=Microbacterium TaxID=33882 RepID=UPI002785A1EA|nr:MULTISPECIES: hypothetical protein [Microbacterium]MDQ1082997.1 Flp pilus assembly protein TadB [Microbacterium sp. SORGH_AS_0344]MDQ1168236.1 Flp pilus assembly protein TadB [Microbacterium proteolyticum]
MSGRDRARGAGLRRVRRIAVWLLPLAALVVILLVLRGAGVPLSAPGVIVVMVILALARVVVGSARRRRRARSLRDPSRPR